MATLVTGATGRLGRILVNGLSSAGVETRVLCRGREPAARLPEGVAVFRGDLREPSTLREAVRGVRRVVHLAAVTRSRDRRAYYEVNSRGTENLLAVLEAEQVEIFLHMSTRALGEEGGAYCHSKLLAEEAVGRAELPAVILRPAEVCGTAEGDPILGLAGVIRKWPVVPVIGDGRYGLAPLHVDDVLSCVREALGRPSLAGNIYTLAGEEVSFDVLVDRISSRLGLRRAKVHIPVAAAKVMIGAAGVFGVGPAPDQVDRLLLKKSSDSSRAKRDLSFSPAGIEALLGRLLAGPGEGEGNRS
jgi:nucleoside-diphosphate-sugar epimerase